MNWKFWPGNDSRLLPKVARNAVVSQFRLDRPTVDRLRCVGKSGALAGRKVHYIRIYDPELLSTDVGIKVGYDELALVSYLKALQFQGHIEKDGAVYLADRRSAQAAPTEQSNSHQH